MVLWDLVCGFLRTVPYVRAYLIDYWISYGSWSFILWLSVSWCMVFGWTSAFSFKRLQVLLSRDFKSMVSMPSWQSVDIFWFILFIFIRLMAGFSHSQTNLQILDFQSSVYPSVWSLYYLVITFHFSDLLCFLRLKAIKLGNLSNLEWRHVRET